MRALALLALLVACTTVPEGEAAARRWMASLGVEGRVTCVEDGTLCSCTVLLADGRMLPLHCKAEGCDIRMPQAQTDTVVVPMPMPQGPR